MRRVISHVRGNIVAYVAIFIALSSTAYAIDGSLPGQNTVGSQDIINGEVMHADLAQSSVRGANVGDGQILSSHVRDDTLPRGGLARGDLRPESVGTSELRDDNLRSEDILDGQIRAIDVAFGTLRGDEILDGTIGGNDITDNSVAGTDVDEPSLFNDNSLTTADLADGSVGAAELKPASVGPGHLSGPLNRADPSPNLIDGGAAHNGAYNTGSSTAACNPGEQIISGYATWSVVPANAELFISSVVVNTVDNSVTVVGGNDSGNDAMLQAVALCLV